MFWLGVVVSVPTLALLASRSRKIRGLTLTAMVFSTVLGDLANINFFSMEAYRGPDRGFELTLTDLLALGLGLGVLLTQAKSLRWKVPNVGWLFIFCSWATLCTLTAPLPLVASFSLFKLFKLSALYWLTLNLFTLGVRKQDYLNGLFLAGFFVTFLAFKQKYLDGYYRIPGPFDHSNTVPIYLLQAVPLVLLWGLCGRMSRWRSMAWISCALGMTFAIAATQSRAGLALVGMQLLLCLLLANRRFPSRRVAACSLLVSALCFVGACKAADTVIERFRSAPKASEEARHEFNLAARKMADDTTLGVGLNNFSHVLTKETRYNAHIVVMANETQAGVAHHIYLLTAAELGWAGLSLAVLLATRFWSGALRSGVKDQSLANTLLLGSALGFSTVHVLGFLEWALRISPVCYLLTLGTAFAVGGSKS